MCLCVLSVSMQGVNYETLTQFLIFLTHRLRRWANISPVLGYRVITDGRPTLTHLLFKASCWYYSQHEVGLLTTVEWILTSTGDAGPTFNRHWVGVGLHCHTRSPVNTRLWTSAGFMLGQRRRRWARIEPALGQRLVFAGSVDRPHLCFHITVCGDIKTVAQLIEPEDDLVTVDRLDTARPYWTLRGKML